MKTATTRATEFVAWLRAEIRDPADVARRATQDMHEHAQEQLRGILEQVEAGAHASPPEGQQALLDAWAVLHRFIDPRLEKPDEGVHVELDCASCAALGKLRVPMECVGADAQVVPWTPARDTDGRTHHHDPNLRTLAFRCPSGHTIVGQARVACWCGWKSGGPAL